MLKTKEKILKKRASFSRNAFVRVKRGRQFVVPKQIYDRLEVKEGDIFEVTNHGGNIVFQPKQSATMFDIYLERGLTEARAGKTVGPFRNMSEYEDYIARTS